MLTVWPAEDHVGVIAIGPHDASTDDVYAVLLDALELDIPDAERTKPSCCDDAEGHPPADEAIATQIADALERRARRSRRR